MVLSAEILFYIAGAVSCWLFGFMFALHATSRYMEKVQARAFKAFLLHFESETGTESADGEQPSASVEHAEATEAEAPITAREIQASGRTFDFIEAPEVMNSIINKQRTNNGV